MTGGTSRFLPDSSCVVALLCTWHERHAAAAREVERRLTRGDVMIVAGPVLIEAYSVLTRMPSPYRLSADAAGRLLSGVIDAGQVAALDGTAYQSLLVRCVGLGIAGGQIYDAVIAACAAAASADVLLTLNARHFPEGLAPGVRVVVPGDAAD